MGSLTPIDAKIQHSRRLTLKIYVAVERGLKVKVINAKAIYGLAVSPGKG